MITSPIRRLLVANRGEIASRIFRTAHAMGISTVAVYSTADAGALHVADADVGVPLPGERAEQTYLSIDALVDAARRTRADALHPGYGFLSENAELADACATAGIRFVGPSGQVIRSMGDKIAAKELASSVGVPTLESIVVEQGSLPDADQLGYPLLVKAAAGGGGRGMRVVQRPEELEGAIDAASREAAASFSSGAVFLERYLAAPRHVEIQIAADQQGNAVHLFERDCSVQRRHQKVIEEAPSTAVGQHVRQQMTEAALTLTRSIGYLGVGTVEFLLDGDAFYFLEMNTRIQVEHPVTEAVTGQDIVRWQLDIASGAPLPLTQDEIALDGHAVEARLYAEDPDADFLPSPGVITHYAWTEVAGVRYDHGVEAGSVVSAHYDAMLSKIIAHGRDRDEAIARLTRALRTLQVDGVVTNREFLLAILADETFVAGHAAIDFLQQRDLANAETAAESDEFHVVAAVLHQELCDHASAPVLGFTPLRWRNVPTDPIPTFVTLRGQTVEVVARVGADGLFEAAVDSSGSSGRVWAFGDRFVDLEYGGLRRRCDVRRVDDLCNVSSSEAHTQLQFLPRHPVGAAQVVGVGPTAEIPGAVVSVDVAEGDKVEAGQTLLVMEAMKMEHRVRAAATARVVEVLVQPGDSVDAGQLLVRLEDAAGDGREE